MKRSFLLLALLATLGCQTTKHECPIIHQTERVIVHVSSVDSMGMETADPSKAEKYQIDFKIYKRGQLVSCPSIIVDPHEWATLDVAIDIRGIEQKAKIQIENEVIEIGCEPGLHVKIFVTPTPDSKTVHLKGVYVMSKSNETNLMRLKETFPFSAYCKLSEKTILYEIITTVD